jgi:hypothetical protein
MPTHLSIKSLKVHNHQYSNQIFLVNLYLMRILQKIIKIKDTQRVNLITHNSYSQPNKL